MLKIVKESTYIHIVSFIRLKQAIFWSFAFPVFLFIVFSGIFGVFYDDDYAAFLLTGVIGMSFASDGLFAIGSIIKRYYQNGTLRILHKMPFNIVNYFIGIIVSRFIIIGILVIVLNIVSLLISSYIMSWYDLTLTFIGIFIGLWIFSFLGLLLNFLSMKKYSSEKGLINIVYFTIIFTSNALYPVKSFNQVISNIADFLPLNPVLQLIRNEQFNIYSIAFWSVLPVVLFYLVYKRIQFTR